MASRIPISGPQRCNEVANHATQVDLFAREFQSEDHLRRVVADLFRKMGHTGVRITHGANEKGKDIVFYSSGPLEEKRLFACVIKNSPITGQAEDYKTGAPTIVNRVVQGVLNQIQSAFGEPLPNGRGTDEWVDSVYVISPYECAPATIDSVKMTLQRGGQTAFKCGQALLELFAKHWPEFLWFESTTLLSYLSALRKHVETDYALANLILQKSAYLSASPSSSLDLYVEPTCCRDLRPYRLRLDHIVNTALLRGCRHLIEIEQEVEASHQLRTLLDTAPLWAHHAETVRTIGDQILALTGEMLGFWRDGYHRYIARLKEEAGRNRSRTGQGFAASGAFTGSAFIPPSVHEVSFELNVPPAFSTETMRLEAVGNAAIGELHAAAEIASDFSRGAHREPLVALASPSFLTYCNVAEVETLAPKAFVEDGLVQCLSFTEDLLDRFDGSVLITGPAGFGKTTFCRWNAIRDATRLVAKEASVLPVYRALHPLSKGPLGTFEDTFFANDELKKLIRQEAEGQAPFTRIRLYLDGLDEVTSVTRQEEIVDLAAQAVKDWRFVQVVLTARDHVNGAALRWLPRVHLQKLTAPKIRLLAERWLGNDRVDGFFDRLNESGSLADLMGIPLLATLILAVYRKTTCVPPNRTNLYTLFVELLCGGWDFYKNIQRRPAKFSTRDKEVALARLAGILQHEGKRDATDADFRVSLKESLSFLEPDWDELLGEIVEDGLLVRVGTALTFTHLSFQEFLAARDLRDHMGNRPKQALGWFLNGKDWWREVLAFYVTLLDRPADTDEWLITRALVSPSNVPDLLERVAYLRTAVQAAFPAYKATSGARRQFGRLQLRTPKTRPEDARR